MKIAILTSMCGMSNSLHNPTQKFDGVDYIAFVDRPHASATAWDQRTALDFTLDYSYKGRRNAKIYKILPHLFLPEYDYWFWVDPTHEVTVCPRLIIEEYMNNADMGLWKHKHRDCAYQEGEELRSLNYDHQELIQDQLSYYKSMKFPEHWGLYELPINIRKNTDGVKILNMRWWEQICKYSSRDQMSFPFVLWKTGVSTKLLPGFANGGSPQTTNPLIPQVRSSPPYERSPIRH
tara:strand:- start:410 stop:1114 length:705 start_codon:yes stop_codon:yes gene_type:complete